MADFRAKLTDDYLREFSPPAGKNDITVWDEALPGFGARVRNGKIAWVVGYRPAGAGRAGPFRKMKVGTPAVLSSTKARAEARILLGRIAAGADPLGERRCSKAAETVTIGVALDRYDAELGRRRYVNRVTVINGLKTKMARLLGRDIKEITGAELARIMEKLEAAGSPAQRRISEPGCDRSLPGL